jgi:hypothetical protein
VSGWKCCLLRLAASSGAAFSRAAFSPKPLQGGGSSSGGGSGGSSGGRSGDGGRQQGEEPPTYVTLEQVRLCYLEKAAQKDREGERGIAAQLVVEAYAEVVDAEHASLASPVAIAYPIGRDSGRDLVDRGDVEERGGGVHSKGRCPVDRAVGGFALVPWHNSEGQEQGAGGGSSGAAGGEKGEGGEGSGFCLALARQPDALGEDLCNNSSNGGHRPVCVCACVRVCIRE